MIVKNVVADGFKNLEAVHIKPHEKYNLITGLNAQGKTNLIEAIWLMSGCRSFRGSREKEFIGLDKRDMRLGLKFNNGRRDQTITYTMTRLTPKEKLIQLNGVKVSGTSKLFEEFKCVVFTPDDIDLIKGGPEKRRSFIDLCNCQLHYKILDTVKRYDGLLAQRNALLKNVNSGSADYNMISVWDNQLAAIGTALSQYRYAYIKLLNETCGRLYKRITGGRETLEIGYHSNIYGTEVGRISEDVMDVAKYYQKLIDTADDDIRLGYTLKGAHRDELTIKINGMNIKEFGSQGQKKTAALVLKLGQAEIFYKNRDEAPIILLDDVMGELDENRQRLVYEIIDGMQVFITACNENAVNGLSTGKHYIVENGRVRTDGE